MKRTIFYFCMLFLLVNLTGCLSSGNYRGSLSDAMDKSRDDYEGDRSVPEYDRDNKDRYDRNDRDDDQNSDRYDREQNNEDQGNEPELASEPTEFESAILIVRGGQGIVTEPYFDSQADGELLLGTSQDSIEFFVFGGFKTEKVKTSEKLAESIDEDVLLLYAGVELRYYPLPNMMFMSPYAMGRIGGQYMFWSFRNDLSSDTYDVSSDFLGGLLLGVGLGVDLVHTDSFRVGATVTPEAYLFSEETLTYEGFYNDLFDPFTTVKWGIEAGFEF